MPDLLSIATALRASATRSCGLVLTLAEVFDQMFGRAQRERQNADSRRFVGAIEKHAGVADIQIRHIVRLSKTVRHKVLRIISHAAGSGFMQAPARNLWCVSRTFEDAARGVQYS